MNKDDLVLNNTNLIYYILQKMGLYSQKEYYYDIGMMGLVKAASTYDPDKRLCI